MDFVGFRKWCQDGSGSISVNVTTEVADARVQPELHNETLFQHPPPTKKTFKIWSKAESDKEHSGSSYPEWLPSGLWCSLSGVCFTLIFCFSFLSVYNYRPCMVAPTCNPRWETGGLRCWGQLGFEIRLLSEAALHTYKYKNLHLLLIWLKFNCIGSL